MLTPDSERHAFRDMSTPSRALFSLAIITQGVDDTEPGTRITMSCSDVGLLDQTGSHMKNVLTIGAAVLLIAGATVTEASAKKMRHHSRQSSQGATMGQGTTTGSARGLGGNNAELMGNNGNSGQGSNSLGHIQGGNIGGGK